ncbi:hypothetical protein OSTOST_24285 [Ostertagia ostertagi]
MVKLMSSSAFLKRHNLTSGHSNLKKCSVLHIGDAVQADYEINGARLKSCQFSEHIDNVVKKAYTVLYLIFRNFRSKDLNSLLALYKAYVRPHLEYCSPIWSPILKKDIHKLEKVQQTFTRLIFLRCFPSTAQVHLPSYNDRLKSLGLQDLLLRRTINDLALSFRILRNESKLKA